MNALIRINKIRGFSLVTTSNGNYTDFFKQTREKVLLFDGAMGTSIQNYPLTEDDFHGNDGCNEYLVKSRPDVIKEVHASYFDAGADVVETDSFGSADIVLAEYDLQDQAYELSRLSAEIAKSVAGDYTDKPRFVAGSVGPTTKLPTLGHISYDALKTSFEVQMQGLVDGGADVLLIETCQDLLQTKAAIAAANRVRKKVGHRIPLMVQVTIEQMGTMLVGMDIATVVTAMQPYDIDVLGMNCATGPQEMVNHVRYLSQHSPFYISCLPNAGIPENIGGQAHYHLTPDQLADHLSHFVGDLGVNVIGGCCGTTPAHIKRISDVVGRMTPGKRNPEYELSASSLYTSVPYVLTPPPVLIGERTNSNGSKKFRDLLSEDNYDELVSIGKEQVQKGAHLLDVCTAYVGRDEVKDMTETITRFNQQLDVPLVIDSTEAPVIETALKLIAGKAIVNSINLEDGEERLETVLPLCKEFGAGVVALTIDEEGMAKTAENKLAIAQRIYDLTVNKYGINGAELIFDPLTFTLGSGDEEFRKAGVETINAIRDIKKAMPDVSFVLGISNISFGLNPAARHVLNSVFLHYAIDAGLNMAIINSAHILPLHQISDEERELCRRLIFDERKFEGEECVSDPLHELMAYYETHSASAAERKEKAMPETVEERLKYRIINGEKTDLAKDLDEALKTYPALEIINTLLLSGMKTVGELFGAGEMQLPFVLQSAETMKAAVAHLEPHMEKSESSTSKGSVVLATVKGDVHDIGKNLVDIILTNNGYKVYNIGIKQSLEQILAKLKETDADAIGMSGLLVKSTAIMKENLTVMHEMGIAKPVILGGAALTQRFVEEDCQNQYQGKVYYARDAFAGLHAMEAIAEAKTGAVAEPKNNVAKKEPVAVGAKSKEAEAEANTGTNIDADADSPYQTVGEMGREHFGLPLDSPVLYERSPLVAVNEPVPKAPFWGTRVVEGIKLNDIYKYLNTQTLFTGQWQVRRGKKTREEHEAFLAENVAPTLEKLKIQTEKENLLDPKVIYGYYPAQSEKNSILVYKPELWEKEGKKEILTQFDFPRGGTNKSCMADYIKSVESGEMDVLGAQIVTVGNKASEYAQKLFEADNYTDYLYFHGFSVEMAEALAEFWHKNMREEMGIAQHDQVDVKKLFAQGYQGSRYSPGYPACPHLDDQAQLFVMLEPERIGITLTEEFMLEPEQSTSALVLHHPEARYFDVR